MTDRSFYHNHDVNLLLGRRGLEIRPETSSVVIDGKEDIFYDRLLIATGASPHLPQEYRNAGILSLRTIEDAEAIITAASCLRHAVVLGGGLVSLQVAQSLNQRGITSTVIVGSKQLLSKNVDEEAAAFIQKAMEDRGISVRLGVNVLSCERTGNAITLYLDTGETLSSPLIVCGKGVRPNLLEGPLCTNESMRVDECMNTCVGNVYCAGDVSLTRHLVSSQWDRIANWPNACFQGWVAGSNMAGVYTNLPGLLNQNITTLFGICLVSIGDFSSHLDGTSQLLRYSDDARKIYRKIFLRDGRIVGAILLNDIYDAGVIKNLISRKTDVSSLLDVSPKGYFNMAKLLRNSSWGAFREFL
jgi:NAD(P)H-nitrite reductase large subunit